MYKQSLNSFLFVLSIFALQLSANASQENGSDVTKTPQLRYSSTSVEPSVQPKALDWARYDDAFNTSKRVRTKGPYGFQMKDYGPLQKHIINDIRNFPQTQGEPLIYCEMAAGYGWFPVYIFRHMMRPIRFIVNDVVPENLLDLKALMSKDKEVGDSFSICEGDCVTLMDTQDFQTLAPRGAHFVSALNIAHYLSPLKVVDFFASVSENLQPGGKFYVMYDPHRPYTLPPRLQNVAYALTENIFRNYPSAFFKYQELVLQDVEACIALGKIQDQFFKKELKKNDFVFPTYVNEEPNTEYVSIFQPSSDFINDLAAAVGLRLEKSGGISRTSDGTCEECQPAVASTLWFVFVKDGINPLNTPGEGHFRYSPRFKKIRQNAELADQQRKGFKFERQKWFPFAQEIPPSWRFNNMLLNVKQVVAEFDQPNFDLSALWSLPSLTDLKFSKTKQEMDRSALKRISPLMLEPKLLPSNPNHDLSLLVEVFD